MSAVAVRPRRQRQLRVGAGRPAAAYGLGWAGFRGLKETFTCACAACAHALAGFSLLLRSLTSTKFSNRRLCFVALLFSNGTVLEG